MLKINNKEITSGVIFEVNNLSIQKLTTNDILSWESYNGPPSPVIITASGDYTAGVDFPANKELHIECAGGAGGGSPDWYAWPGHGGSGTSCVNVDVTLVLGEIVSVVVGVGGPSKVGELLPGNAGSASNFGSYVTGPGGSGGSPANGGGSTCGSDGCFGSGACNSGTGGITGGGGGGPGMTGGSGAGGRGEIRISWT